MSAPTGPEPRFPVEDSWAQVSLLREALAGAEARLEVARYVESRSPHGGVPQEAAQVAALRTELLAALAHHQRLIGGLLGFLASGETSPTEARWTCLREGGHIHVQVATRTLPTETWARCGELTFNEQEWPAVRAMAARGGVELVEADVPAGVSAFFGKWPGEETSEELLQQLDEVRGKTTPDREGEQVGTLLQHQWYSADWAPRPPAGSYLTIHLPDCGAESAKAWQARLGGEVVIRPAPADDSEVTRG